MSRTGPRGFIRVRPFFRIFVIRVERKVARKWPAQSKCVSLARLDAIDQAAEKFGHSGPSTRR